MKKETKEETGKDTNAFEEVKKSVMQEDENETPVEATDCEVEEATDIINLDKETSDRG
ncbi:hypothetical protein [Dysgonomonas sp. 25]|uniref:hypothetical protein n=1 Tax=Dysgonomonas sp. 25 TaxID=2302933 RepID=UPI0013D0A188|nr:hypothetical protein [Dysgonomonas sp. 25]